MPWQEVAVFDAGMRFIQDVQRHVFSMAELCQRHHISRPVAYKWLRRFEGAGPRTWLITPDARPTRPMPSQQSSSRRAMRAPNDVWTIDYKGQFKTRDGAYRYRLTVQDRMGLAASCSAARDSCTPRSS